MGTARRENNTTMSTLHSTYGTISISDNDYSPIRELVAMPKDGYEFFAWTGDTEGIDEHSPQIMVDLTKTSTKHLFANFIESARYLAQVQQADHGTASVKDNEVGYSWQKCFEAIPNIGYRFDRWNELGSTVYINDGNCKENPLIVPLSKDNPTIILRPSFVEDRSLTRLTYANGTTRYIQANGTLQTDDLYTQSGRKLDSNLIDRSIVSIKLGDQINDVDEKCFMNCKSLTHIAKA